MGYETGNYLITIYIGIVLFIFVSVQYDTQHLARSDLGSASPSQPALSPIHPTSTHAVNDSVRTVMRSPIHPTSTYAVNDSVGQRCAHVHGQ